MTEDHFASIRFKFNPQKDMLLEALEHVKYFIVQHKLILVGGMSIDSALRLKGLKIYDDDEIPDYDFYSPKNAEHAYLLGSELCAKYPNVDVITAIHTTTMKVRVDGNVVADITYMPPEIFARLPTLEYQGVRIVHPWMVMLDQFRSLSTPYENPPNEVIFERWRKDITRLNLLLKCYSLGDVDKKIKMPKLYVVKLPKLDQKSITNGWAALAQWEAELKIDGLAATADAVSIPVDYCTVATTDIASWVTADTKYFNQLFSYPHHIRRDALEVFDFWGERMTRVGSRASIPAMMFYFLNSWLLRGDDVALLGVRRVTALMQLTKVLSIEPLGDESWNTSTLYGVASTTDYPRVKTWKPATQPFDAPNCEIRRTFDPAKSPLFAIDGAECEAFTEIVDRKLLQIN